MAYGNGNNKKNGNTPKAYNGLNGDMSALGATTSTGIETPMSDFLASGPPIQPMEQMKPRPMNLPTPSIGQKIAQGESKILDEGPPSGIVPMGINEDVSALGFTAQSGIDPSFTSLPEGPGRRERTVGPQAKRPMPEWMKHQRNRRGGDYGERSGSGISAGWFAGGGPRKRRNTTGRVSSEFGTNW